MRNLSQEDMLALEEHSVQIISPIPKNQLYRSEASPVFLAEVGQGTQAHVHFEWLGVESDADSSRTHWERVIDLFGAGKAYSEIVQPIFQCVDLGDFCTLAVAPMRTLVDQFRPGDLPQGYLKGLVCELAVAMVKLGQTQIWLLSIDLDDVLLADGGGVVLSSRAEFCWGRASQRESRKNGIELVVSYLLRLEEEIPLLSAQIQEIRGIALAVLDHNGNGGDLGQLVLALRAGMQPDGQNFSTIPAELETQTDFGRWVRPAATATPNRRKHLGIVMVLVAVSAFAILGFGSQYFEKKTAGFAASQEMTEHTKPTSTPKEEVFDFAGNNDTSPQRDPSALNQVTNATNLELDIQGLLERRAALFTLTGASRERALANVYVDPTYGAELLRESLGVLEASDASLSTPKVVVHAVTESNNSQEDISAIVEYTLTYTIEIDGKASAQRETEIVQLNLERFKGQLLIRSVEALG